MSVCFESLQDHPQKVSVCLFFEPPRLSSNSQCLPVLIASKIVLKKSVAVSKIVLKKSVVVCFDSLRDRPKKVSVCFESLQDHPQKVSGCLF